ncbi:MAG: hypothetical protein QOI66_4276, partial [Myxococcales bacterium]|nr:hypothetical protein [Myxococcales bacterium]
MQHPLGLALSTRFASFLFFSMIAATSCGRSDLFSAKHCPPSEPNCVIGSDNDGGSGPDAFPRVDGGTGGRGGSGGTGGRGGSGGTGGRGGSGGSGGIGGTGGRGGSGGATTCPPGNPENCTNGRDDDCNGRIDCADPACFGNRACITIGQEVCNNGLDDDEDGLIDCADPDCIGNTACRPNMGMEICDNGKDDNGDRLIDCSDPQCVKFPGCLTIDCTADVDFGTRATPDASVTRTLDTRRATREFATCATPGGRGRVGRFQLNAPADVRLDFSQPTGAAHVVALFRAGANQACDQNLVNCVQAGQDPSTTRTFAGLAAGTYWLIVESFPGAPAATTVTLSTGSAAMPEICNNGKDDDGNGLIDCQDLACRNDAACTTSLCVPDVALGTLIVDGPAKSVSVDTRTNTNRFHPTCAGTSTAGDRTISLTLPEAGGILVDYTQQGQHTFALFELPPPGQACDASQLDCILETRTQSSFAITNVAAGRYLFIIKAASPNQEGRLDLRISAFKNRQVEICANGIDDDGNGLVDCADPECFGVGSCTASSCMPDVDLGTLSLGGVKSTTLDITTGRDLYQTKCGRGNGKEKVVRITLTEPMGLGVNCNETGSQVLELAQQVAPLDACNDNEVSCGDPEVIPFGCSYIIPSLQAGQYNLIVEAFQSGTEGTVRLTLSGEREVVREICDNGIDDDLDGATDCADRKCVTSPLCAKFACRPDKTLGVLPLDGNPTSVAVETSMSVDDQHMTCTSAAGGQDAVIDFQLPAKADLTIEWAQVGSHVLAVYSNGGVLLACDAGTLVNCIASANQTTGMQLLKGLPAGKYHLVVDADKPGSEGGVVLQLSGV